MSEPRRLAAELEQAALPDGPAWERMRGYAVAGVPFRSGHILALRRFPVTSLEVGYTGVWYRDPAGRWVMYHDQPPEFTCPRAFGPELEDAREVPIDIDWTGSHRFRVRIDADRFRLDWDVPLVDTVLTRALSSVATVLPRKLRHHPLMVKAAGGLLGPVLRSGRARFAGTAPSGQRFFADLHRIWLIDGSTAVLNGTDLGLSGPVADQTRLGDFWLPQRGLFAIADSFFEPHDPARHRLVASRHDLREPAGSARAGA